MAKQTKSLKEATALAHAELLKCKAQLDVCAEHVDLTQIGSDSLTLEARYCFTVHGSVHLHHKLDGANDAFKPVVETNFPSTHRDGAEMVLFAQLVADLTNVAVRLQVFMDQFEIVHK
jgi:hypothetical protein